GERRLLALGHFVDVQRRLDIAVAPVERRARADPEQVALLRKESPIVAGFDGSAHHALGESLEIDPDGSQALFPLVLVFVFALILFFVFVAFLALLVLAFLVGV